MNAALNWLRYQMKILGLSQGDLSVMSGVQRAQISFIMNGHRAMTTAVLRKLLVGAFKFSEKDADSQIAQWKLEEAAERAKAAGVAGYDFGQKTVKPQMILVSDTPMKFATNTFAEIYGNHFMVSILAGELIDARYILSAQHFKDLYLLMGELVKRYEQKEGEI